MHIASLPESGNPLEGEARPVSGEPVSRDFTVEGETAKLTPRSEGGFGPVLGSWDGDRGWQMKLAPAVPLDLEISLGVGKSEANLSDLTVTDLLVSIGIGTTTVVLPAEGSFQARIESAIGKTVVVVPEGLAARVRAEVALGSTDLPEGYLRQVDTHVSPDFESADHQVELEVSQAIGQIELRHGRNPSRPAWRGRSTHSGIGESPVEEHTAVVNEHHPGVIADNPHLQGADGRPVSAPLGRGHLTQIKIAARTW